MSPFHFSCWRLSGTPPVLTAFRASLDKRYKPVEIIVAMSKQLLADSANFFHNRVAMHGQTPDNSSSVQNTAHAKPPNSQTFRIRLIICALFYMRAIPRHKKVHFVDGSYRDMQRVRRRGFWDRFLFD